MLAFLLQTADTLKVNLPSFTDRFNFAVPLIALLLILMFFLLIKSFQTESRE